MACRWGGFSTKGSPRCCERPTSWSSAPPPCSRRAPRCSPQAERSADLAQQKAEREEARARGPGRKADPPHRLATGEGRDGGEGDRDLEHGHALGELVVHVKLVRRLLVHLLHASLLALRFRLELLLGPAFPVGLSMPPRGE